MALTPHQVELVQTSFKKVEPIADTAADIFYTTLFEYDPELRSLFKGDIKQQGRKLMTMLKTAVASLNDLAALVPALEALADRHIQYGVKVDDYTPVGNALLHTLKVGLGDDFTPEVKAAWIEVYQIVADTMRSHSYPGFATAT